MYYIVVDVSSVLRRWWCPFV